MIKSFLRCYSITYADKAIHGKNLWADIFGAKSSMPNRTKPNFTVSALDQTSRVGFNRGRVASVIFRELIQQCRYYLLENSMASMTITTDPLIFTNYDLSHMGGDVKPINVVFFFLVT